ncbi:MAG TPA: hypothetical protein VNV37_08415 [Solirubrobacteraceae bacterium]|nr:hypothetical protein [Solirubrobacteraceae bacterium]
MHVQELALLLPDFFEDAVAAVDLLLGGGGSLAEVDGERLADFLAFGLGDRDTAVVVFDGGFDDVDGLVALGALAVLVAGTDEVLVHAAVAVVLGVDEAAAAGAAADRALEVVLVCAVALARVVVSLEHGLDLVEELKADDGSNQPPQQAFPRWLAAVIHRCRLRLLSPSSSSRSSRRASAASRRISLLACATSKRRWTACNSTCAR